MFFRINKCIIFSFSILFLVFFASESVNAQVYKIKGLNCPEYETGKNYSVFLLSQTKTDADNLNGTEVCLLLPTPATSVDFSQIQNAGNLPNWGGVTLNKQIYAKQCNITLKGNIDFWSDITVEQKVEDTVFELETNMSYLCSDKTTKIIAPFRYQLNFEPEKKYLQFVGFLPTPKIFWQSVSPKDPSSILVDRGKIVKVVLKVVTTDPEESFAQAGVSGIICPECGVGMFEDLVMDVSVISPQERTVTLTWDTLDVVGAKYTVNLTAKGTLAGDVVVPITFQIKEVPNCKDFSEKECSGVCFFYKNLCQHKFDTQFCPQITDKKYCGTKEGIPDCKWNDSVCETPVQAAVSEEYGAPEGYAGPLPTCAFSGNCRDVNKLLELAVNYIQMLFGVIGSLAFVMFIFGGFTILTSFGSPEKVKKGQGILVAAVVGILIAFGAYVMIDFVLDALQVSEGFREIQ